MTDIICTLIKFVRASWSFLIPDALFQLDFVNNFLEYIDFFLDIIVQVNFLIPLPTIFSCLSIMVSLKIVKLVIFVQNWIIRSVLDVIP